MDKSVKIVFLGMALMALVWPVMFAVGFWGPNLAGAFVSGVGRPKVEAQYTEHGDNNRADFFYKPGLAEAGGLIWRSYEETDVEKGYNAIVLQGFDEAAKPVRIFRIELSDSTMRHMLFSPSEGVVGVGLSGAGHGEPNMLFVDAASGNISKISAQGEEEGLNANLLDAVGLEGGGVCALLEVFQNGEASYRLELRNSAGVLTGKREFALPETRHILTAGLLAANPRGEICAVVKRYDSQGWGEKEYKSSVLFFDAKLEQRQDPAHIDAEIADVADYDASKWIMLKAADVGRVKGYAAVVAAPGGGMSEIASFKGRDFTGASLCRLGDGRFMCIGGFSQYYTVFDHEGKVLKKGKLGGMFPAPFTFFRSRLCGNVYGAVAKGDFVYASCSTLDDGAAFVKFKP